MAIMLTRADLEALPDDGLRHELIDGTLVMNPAPGVPHQTVAFALARVLFHAASGTGLKVLPAPVDVVLGPNVVQPDVVVAPATAFTERCLPCAPLLVVEVRSATTRWLDEGRKRSMYEEYGVAWYWLVDPVEPAVTILELVDGRYVEVTCAVGEEVVRMDHPLRVRFTPVELTAG